MDPYYEDEFYEDDDYDRDEYEDDEPKVVATSYDCYLNKAANGHLWTCETRGWCYAHQDWGETVGQWEVVNYRLSEIKPWIAKLAVAMGREMQPGDSISFPYWMYEDEEYEGDDDRLPVQ